jgi:hypothetical protein
LKNTSLVFVASQVCHFGLKNATEAEVAAEVYLVERFSAPEGNVEVSRVDFDGNFYEVCGHYVREGNRVDFKVKIEREGNVVGWSLTP